MSQVTITLPDGSVRSLPAGARVRTPEGWWLMRASNTQAVIVVRAEAGSEAGLERLKTQLVAELAPSGLALPG